MTKICILIASHIYYDNQIELFKNCLLSLKNQTYTADIYVSVSFENEKFKELFINNILNIVDNINILFILSDKQLYQMEHIYVFNEYIKKYDLIMFCDDDDTYDKERVELINKMYIEYLSNKKDREFAGFIEIIDVEMDDAPEFWCYTITPIIYNDFYDRCKNDMDLLKYDYGDMYFRNYLRLISDKKYYYYTYKLDRPSYNHYTNPDGICGSQVKKDLDICIRNVIIVLISCLCNIDFVCNKVKLSENDLYIYVPELDRIKKLCYDLYDNIEVKNNKIKNN